MASDNSDFQAEDLVDPADFAEKGGPGDTLNAGEGTDSDELHIYDDTVVDPREGWSEADMFGMTAREEREGESPDDRLAEEEPDVSDGTGSLEGAPEDGGLLYEVVDESGAPDFTQTKE